MPEETEQTSPNAEIARLRRELQAAEAELAAYRRGTYLAKSAAGYLSYGPSLARALEQWEAAFSANPARLVWRRIPRHESVLVVAAYLRRRALSGLLIATLAAIPGVATVILLWQQNAKIDQQIHLTSFAQASQLQAVLAETLIDLYSSAQKTCLEDELVVRDRQGIERLMAAANPDLQDLDRYRCWNQVSTTDESTKKMWVDLYRVGRVLLLPMAMPGYLTKAKLPPRGEEDPFLYSSPTPNPQTHARAISLSAALRPYHSVVQNIRSDQSPVLSPDASSPERGILLRAYVDNGFSPEGLSLEKAWAPGSSLMNIQWGAVSLTDAVLECSRVQGGFRDSDLSRIRAAGADFSSSDLSELRSANDADLRHAVFDQSVLPRAEVLKGANIEGATFVDSIVPTDRWLESVTGVQDPEYRYERIAEGRWKSHWRMKARTLKRSYFRSNTHCELRRSKGFQ